MRVYEGLFLVSNNDANKDIEAVYTHIREILEKHGSTIHIIHKWDERKLAYEIKKMRRGTYLLSYFSTENDALPKITRDLSLSETVVRHMFIRDSEELLPRHSVEHLPSEYKVLGSSG